MNAEDILIDLKELSSQYNITKTELMEILKKYTKIISVQDLMMTPIRMRKKENMSRQAIVKNTWKYISNIS